MEKDIDSLRYYIYNAKTGVYIDSKRLPANMFKAISINLKGNCPDEELFGSITSKPDWYKSILKKDDEIIILEIDLDNSTIEQQRRFISLIKDRKIDVYTIPNNTRILVYSSDMSKIDKELFSLLVVV